MDENREYEIPEDVALLMDKKLSNEALRDLYVKIPFGFKKASKCAANVPHFDRKFWDAVFVLYPELKSKKLSYNVHSRTVTVI